MVSENYNVASSYPIKSHDVPKNNATRSKRVFGRDLTNEQDRNANVNQKRGSKPSKANEDTEPVKGKVENPVVMVVDEDGDDDMSDLSEITPEPKLMPWDEADSSDDLSVPEYAKEIMEKLREQEDASKMRDFMKIQEDVNTRMRCVLVDWLIEVHRKFKLSRPSYFLAINMVDRYLAKKSLKRTKLQLLGCTCLWIASKYHEIYAPEMDDFVYISDKAFSDEQMMGMEVEILKTLSFELTVPTVLNYAQRYAKISSHYLEKERDMKIIADLIMYCTEQCVMTYDLCQRAPSLIGAACFVYSCLSTKVFSLEMMREDGLEKVIGYSLKELVPTMKILDEAVKNAKRSKHKALYKKYCSVKHSNIGKLNFARLRVTFLE